MRTLWLIVLAVLLLGCDSDSKTSEPSADCRMLRFACAPGFVCSMSEDGNYDCLPESEDSPELSAGIESTEAGTESTAAAA